MPLSDMKVRALKSGPKVRRIVDERGLYLELSVSGAKLWRFKFRFHGKEKRLAFGIYPDVGLKDARELRDEARKLLAKGIDPGEVKRAQKDAVVRRAATSFEVVAREFHARQSAAWVKEHSARWLGRMERHVFPLIGRRPIDEITAPDLLVVLRRVEVRAVETAHRLRFQCGQVFKYSIATGLCQRNVATDLQGALQPKRAKHFASQTSPNAFAPILRAVYSYDGSTTVNAALRVAPLVFVRPGELRMMRKADVDLDAAEWRYTSSKTKQQHLVPLSQQVVQLLRELDLFTGTSQYVFPGARSPHRPMSDGAVNAALRILEIPRETFTGHGFRAAARTILDEVLGFRADIIEHQLAHEVRDPNGRAYNRTSFLPERRKMMQVWADYCDELRSQIVTLPRTA